MFSYIEAADCERFIFGCPSAKVIIKDRLWIDGEAEIKQENVGEENEEKIFLLLIFSPAFSCCSGGALLKLFESGLSINSVANLFGERKPFDLHRGGMREIGIPNHITAEAFEIEKCIITP